MPFPHVGLLGGQPPAEYIYLSQSNFLPFILVAQLLVRL